MKYKGIELKEVTDPQIFIPPKKMLVWDRYGDEVEQEVYAITTRKDSPVICENTAWRHCAEIPKVPESELVTYRELAQWLAEGYGEVKTATSVFTSFTYTIDYENKVLQENVSVRKWYDTEWHKPTREYLGLED